MARIVIPGKDKDSPQTIDASPGTILLLGRSQLRSLLPQSSLAKISRFAIELTVTSAKRPAAADPADAMNDRPIVAELINAGTSRIEVRAPDESVAHSLEHGQTARALDGDALVLLPSSDRHEQALSTFRVLARHGPSAAPSIPVPPPPQPVQPQQAEQEHAQQQGQPRPPSPSLLPRPRTFSPAAAAFIPQFSAPPPFWTPPRPSPLPSPQPPQLQQPNGSSGLGEGAGRPVEDDEDVVHVVDHAAGPSTSAATRVPQMLLLIGLQGSGKSTFATRLVKATAGRWVRVNQDSIAGPGKKGTRDQCIAAARIALQGGQNVVIDRCNFDAEQRASFIQLASQIHGRPVPVQCVMLQHPPEVCKRRASERPDHEGGLTGILAHTVVERTHTQLEWPSSSRNEGIARGIVVTNDHEADLALQYCIDGAGVDEQGTIDPTPPPQNLRIWVAAGAPNARGALLPTVPVTTASRPGVAARSFLPPPPPAASTTGLISSARGHVGSQREGAGGLGGPSAFSVLMSAPSRAAGASGASRSGGSAQAGASRPPGGGGGWRLNIFLPVIRYPEGAHRTGDQFVFRIEPDFVLLRDKFAKARHHALVLPRDERLASCTDLTPGDVPLLQRMVAAGEAWVREQQAETIRTRNLSEDAVQRAMNTDGPRVLQELRYRLGFHLRPSMRQVHLHVISQDFCADAIKKKEHVNSFVTPFFVPAEDVIQELEATGRWSVEGPEKEAKIALYSGALATCPHCGRMARNLPDWKQHMETHA